MVGSMKRGIEDHSGDLQRRESRLRVLCESRSACGAIKAIMVSLTYVRFDCGRSFLCPYSYLDQETLHTLVQLVRRMKLRSTLLRF